MSNALKGETMSDLTTKQADKGLNKYSKALLVLLVVYMVLSSDYGKGFMDGLFSTFL